MIVHYDSTGEMMMVVMVDLFGILLARLLVIVNGCKFILAVQIPLINLLIL